MLQQRNSELRDLYTVGKQRTLWPATSPSSLPSSHPESCGQTLAPSPTWLPMWPGTELLGRRTGHAHPAGMCMMLKAMILLTVSYFLGHIQGCACDPTRTTEMKWNLWSFCFRWQASHFPPHLYLRGESRRAILWPVKSVWEWSPLKESRIEKWRDQENWFWCRHLIHSIKPGLKPSRLPPEFPFMEGNLGTVFCHLPSTES